MPAYTFAQRERATRALVKAIPPAACGVCFGSGFFDTIDENTGEIVPMPCRATPACSAHADRAHRWFSEMLYWWGVTQLPLTNPNYSED